MPICDSLKKDLDELEKYRSCGLSADEVCELVRILRKKIDERKKREW